jgi:ABC-type dipeptide/oligopeptide/nickel transport system ATPase component
MVGVIVGKSGSGKTYLAKYVIKQMIPYKRVIIISNRNEYDIPALYEAEITRSTKGRIDYANLVMKKSPLFLSYLLTDQDVTAELDRLSEALMQVGNTALFIDEAHLFFPRWRASEGLNILVKAGRKEGIDTVFITQMPVDLNPAALKQKSYIVSFQVTEPSEIERLRVGFEDYRYMLPDLTDHQFLIWYADKMMVGKGRL